MATAGHVDHGKSTLVRVLTGTDPDRFAEEKRRGLTIDLGFAEMAELGIAFVDVPGHVKFVRNMLAGVGMVDAALFVVDSNEGWKAQSEEHLRILDLIGVDRGVVALTKASDPELVELVHLEVAERLAGSGLEAAPVVAVDALSGVGMNELRSALAAVAGEGRRVEPGRSRLWVDRSFPRPGAGTVVTGTLTGGPLRVGDEVEVGGRPARIRRLQTFGTDTEEATPGSRVAVALVGVDHAEVRRGDALVHPGRWAPTGRFDAAVTVLGSAPRGVGGRGALALHVGSAEHPVRLSGRAVAPGEQGWLRLTISAALPLQPGDRFVLRDLGDAITVGGGEVLDVEPVLPLSRATPDRSVDRVVAERGWIRADELERLTGERREPNVGTWIIDPSHAETERASLVARVEAAGTLGLDIATLDERARSLLAGTDVVVADGRARLGVDDLEGHPYLAALAAAPFDPPKPDLPAGELQLLLRRGLAVERDGVVFAPSAVDRAAEIVGDLLRAHAEGVTTSAVREALGTSRRVVVPLLGLLDSRGFTVRRGDVRLPGPRFR